MKGPYYDALVIANEKHYAYLASALSGLSVVYNQAAVEIIKTFSFTTEFESKYIFGLVKEYVKYFYKIEVSLINYRTKNKVQRKNLQLKAEVYYEKNKIVAFKKEIKSLEKLIDYKTYRANQEKLFIENESEINSFFISANKKIINLQDMRVSQKQIDLTDHLVDAKKNLEKLLESETLRLENRPAIIDEKIERVVRRLAFNKAHLNNTINEFTENQKIQIATLHAIILDPRIITFNSPHLMIDSYVVPQLLSTFQKVAKVFNITFIFSIKNSNLMFKLSDEILIVEDNKLLEFGTPKKIIKNPVRRETISLLKSVMTNYNETLQVCDRVVREHISEFASLETKEIKRDHHALIKHTPGERK
ncbi:MAG: hypothetical protein DRP42_00300 [Tenericutes bacterium]|nr:MAG: hypothetical protein DRP42_00300 [Mycoplasmatota bacterium]